MYNNNRASAFTGLAWGVGGLVPAFYGKEPAKHQLGRLSHQLGDFLSSQAVAIPPTSELATTHLRFKPSTLDGVQNFLYTHPSQMLNAVYAIGGTTLMYSGLNRAKPDYNEARSGGLVTTGGLIGLLLPEAKHTSEKLEKKTDSWFQWAMDKPLRISGLLYSLNNITLTLSAFNERAANPANSSYYLKLLTAGSYVVANHFLGSSSKEQVTDTSTLEALERMAAEIIAAQPAHMQEGLIAQVSEFLTACPELKSDAATLSAQLHQRIAQPHADKTISAAMWQGTVQPSAPSRNV